MNLFKTGVSGMNAAQAMMQTTSNNITNATTVGYHRQSVLVSTRAGQAGSSGFLGTGVQVDSVTRDYSRYQYTQILNASGKNAALTSQVAELSAVDSSLSSNSAGIAPALSAFFTSLNSLASSPDDASVRQEVLGKGNDLATQIRSIAQSLQSQREGLNTQITDAVSSANSLLDRINQLNQQIVTAKATSNGQPPNDLLDQRDQALSDLNDLIGVKSSEDAQGRLTITLTSGQALLSGTRTYPLSAVASASDPSRVVLAYSVPDGLNSTKSFELADGDVSGGTIGGLTTFRSESLDVYQNRLGQLSVGLAMQINTIQNGGLTAEGVAGTDFFSVPTFQGLSHSKNTGTATISGTFADSTAITTDNYSVSYAAGQYTVTNLTTKASVVTDGSAALEIDGLSLAFAGTPSEGDSWALSPTRDAATTMQQLIQSPEDIAAASTVGGSANGENAQALANLQTARFFNGGATSVTEQYAQTVNIVAVQTAQAKSELTSQTALLKSRTESQVGGVNLDAEYTDLLQFQNFYQANARVIDAATKVFDAILGLTS